MASEGADVGACTVSTLAGDNSRSRRARDSSDTLPMSVQPSLLVERDRAFQGSRFKAYAEMKEL